MKEVNYTGEEVVGLTATYLPAEDVAFVQKALDFATEAHKLQFRKSGEPYIVHPIQVAGILAGLKLDAVTVACGAGCRCLGLFPINSSPFTHN
ncbi:TPA: HD domain-containing protein [Streptococcus suis]